MKTYKVKFCVVKAVKHRLDTHVEVNAESEEAAEAMVMHMLDAFEDDMPKGRNSALTEQLMELCPDDLEGFDGDDGHSNTYIEGIEYDYTEIGEVYAVER